MYPLTYIDRNGRTVTVALPGNPLVEAIYGADGTVTDVRFLGYETPDDPDSGDSGDCDDSKDKDDTDLYDVPFVVGE
jgi:hypothetical protein